MRIFLHLGLHKTGTTYLQRVFDLNRDRLLAAGVVFPKTGFWAKPDTSSRDAHSGHEALAAAFAPAKAHNVANYFRNALLTELLTSGADTAVISSENFFYPDESLDPVEVASVLSCVGQVIPVVYLRRQDRYVDSLYREVLGWKRSRYTFDIGEFARSFLGDAWLDFGTRLEPWSQVFGPAAIVARSYDDVIAKDSLLNDFLTNVVDRQVEILQPPTTNINRSLSPSMVNVLRALNQMSAITDAQKAEIVRELRDDPQYGTEFGSKSSLVDDRLWSELAETYRQQNAVLAEIVLSGPSEKFQFEPQRTSTTLVEQTYSLAEANALIVRRWPDVGGAETTSRADGESRPRHTSGRTLALPTVGLTALSQASPERIPNWLSYHLNLGVRHIVLFHEGEPLPRHLATLPSLTIINCDENFWRSMFVAPATSDVARERLVRRLGQQLLAAKGVDWVIGLEASELLAGDLLNELSEVSTSVDLVELPPAEAVLHDDMSSTVGFESRVFKVLPVGLDQREQARHEYEEISPFSRLGFFGEIASTVCARSTVVADFWGNHEVVNVRERLSRVAATRSLILRFDLPSIETWHETWRSRVVARLRTELSSPKARAKYEQLDKALSAKDNGAVRRAYNSWFTMDRATIERRQQIGLLVQPDVPDELFCHDQVGRTPLSEPKDSVKD